MHKTDQVQDEAKYGPFSAVLVTVGAYFASQAGASLLFGFFIFVAGQPLEKFLNDSAGGQFVTILVFASLMAAIILAFMKKRKITRKEVGLTKPNWPDFLWAMGGFVVYIVLS